MSRKAHGSDSLSEPTQDALCTRAFTLAEIIITLGIIGIIAAILIPGIVTSYQKKIQYSAFKNAHSDLNQLLKLSRTANGAMKTWDFNTNNSNTTGFNKYFLPYIDINKDCGAASGNSCFATEYKDMKNVAYTIPSDSRKVVLANGTALSYEQRNNCITTDGNPVGTRTTNPYPCVTFLVDINGVENPNRMGRDLFEFQVYQFYDIVNPSGTFAEQYDSTQRVWTPQTTANRDANCSSAGVGNYCGAKLIEDGAMKY